MHNDLIIKKHKKTCRNSNYFEHSLTFISVVRDCVSISAFASLVNISPGITSSAVRLKMSALTAGIKKYKSIINKRKKHDTIVLLVKAKLNAFKAFISEAVIHSYISHEEFVSVNVLRENKETKQEILKMLWNILYKYG